MNNDNLIKCKEKRVEYYKDMRIEYGFLNKGVNIIKYQDLNLFGKIKYWIGYLHDQR